MESKLIKNYPENISELILVSLDEHSLDHLVQGSPLRIAFFADSQDNFPWYKRKCKVVIIGKKLDFKKYQDVYKDDSFIDGLIDRSYLKSAVRKLKKKFIETAIKELDADISHQPNTFKIEEIKEIKKPQEDDGFLSFQEARELLNCSSPTLRKVIKENNIRYESWHNIQFYSISEKDLKEWIRKNPDRFNRFKRKNVDELINKAIEILNKEGKRLASGSSGEGRQSNVMTYSELAKKLGLSRSYLSTHLSKRLREIETRKK